MQEHKAEENKVEENKVEENKAADGLSGPENDSLAPDLLTSE